MATEIDVRLHRWLQIKKRAQEWLWLTKNVDLIPFKVQVFSSYRSRYILLRFHFFFGTGLRKTISPKYQINTKKYRVWINNQSYITLKHFTIVRRRWVACCYPCGANSRRGDDLFTFCMPKRLTWTPVIRWYSEAAWRFRHFASFIYELRLITSCHLLLK